MHFTHSSPQSVHFGQMEQEEQEMAFFVGVYGGDYTLLNTILTDVFNFIQLCTTTISHSALLKCHDLKNKNKTLVLVKLISALLTNFKLPEKKSERGFEFNKHTVDSCK